MYMRFKKNILLSFVVGSSLPAFIILFVVVIHLFQKKEATFNYYHYSLKAPLGLGLAAAIAKSLHLYFNMNLRKAYLLVSLITATVTSINISRGEGAYNFQSKYRWYLQYAMIFIGHFFIFNVIIFNLDRYLSP